ncbi:hypothetical protein CBR_g25723 [Chara braunii]|uniref:CCHC-type domain-containing protein n=1 Tax=Chara braunii TaxID=69332 RepID=A0A388L6C7_CHABU|nr:hypothetical protein CBR_g25723 [Chara braunii]|eukprot:GBG77792.1 hypothetical protein CBR_g25723 [Chara braunii]
MSLGEHSTLASPPSCVSALAQQEHVRIQTRKGQWYPKTPMKPPLAFSCERKDEELNTWLRTVPVWVKAKRTLLEDEVVTVASYLEGKAAKWLDGVVVKAGYGRRMADWAKSLTLDQFMEMVEARWHNPQEAQKATDAINILDQRKFKSVRELTTTVESPILVPSINYSDQFLLTTFVRCLPENIRNLLASEARIEYHSFETLSRKTLDLEATLGNAQPSQNDTKKKKSPQEWKKKGAKLMMVESDGTQTEINELTDLMDYSEYDGEETAEGSTLAAVVKAKAGGRGKGQPKSQGKAASNQTKMVDWVKAGLDQDVWRESRVRGSCINCGEYGHSQYKCQNAKKLDDFLKLVEDRSHDPQEAQKATDAILTLHTRQFKSVREATDAVERLICVPRVRYDPQVLLASYLRCFPMPLKNQLPGEANINMHNFPLFSKKALDLEAKIGHGQTPTTDGRRKSVPPNWKGKGRVMFIDNNGSTIELDDNFQEGVGSEPSSVEASRGGVVIVVAKKGKATGRRRGGARSRSQVDPNAPPLEKAGLTEDVWRDWYTRQACIRCGQYVHNQFKCRNKKVTEKIPPTMGQALGSSASVGSNVASSYDTAPGNASGQ